jgi:phage tail-like protein
VADARFDCTITMFDREYNEATTWTVYNAWPSKISGPNIAADSNDFTIEELTIVHEGLFRMDKESMVPHKEDAT